MYIPIPHMVVVELGGRGSGSRVAAAAVKLGTSAKLSATIYHQHQGFRRGHSSVYLLGYHTGVAIPVYLLGYHSQKRLATLLVSIPNENSILNRKIKKARVTMPGEKARVSHSFSVETHKFSSMRLECGLR